MRKISFLFIFIIILAGCSSTTAFHGQSPSWKATYEVTEAEGGLERTLSLIYKGDIEDLEAAEKISYSFESESAEMAGEYDLTDHVPKNKSFTFEVESASDQVEEDTEVIDMMVKVGTNVETFQLH